MAKFPLDRSPWLPETLPKSFHGLLRGARGVRERQNLSRNKALVVQAFQRINDRFYVQMPESNRLPVRVRKMHMAQFAAGLTEGRRHIRLLDVHVEQISEDFYI